MNEKYRQYYYLANDKLLINQHTPTANEVQEFNIWKEKAVAHRKKSSKIAILIISFMIIFTILIRIIS